MPGKNRNNLNPIVPGEIRNKWGRAGRPEHREELKRKKMEEKLIKDAVEKELKRYIEDAGMTVLEMLVRKTIQNAANGNDRLFSKLVDMIDGPIVQKSENKIDNNQSLGVIILPKKQIEEG